MIVRALSNTEEISRWNDYVFNHSQATPYHLHSWLKSVETAYRHQTTALMAEEDNQIVGVLPIVIMRMPIVSDQATSLPYCDLGGMLADDEAATKELLTHGIDFCHDNKIQQFEIRQRSEGETHDESSLAGNKVRMLLPLPENSDLLSSSFKAKLRSQINKSTKNGLTATITLGLEEPASIDEFYQVYCINMRTLGSPVHSKEWFIQIARNYDKNCIVCIVRLEGKAVAGGVVLRTSNKASIPWASTLPEYNRLAPNMLLYWSLLEYCADHGVAQFDFGRSTYDEGTYRFKKQWGAQPELLQWDRYQNGQKLDQQHSKSNAISLRSHIESGWRLLPLPVTTWMGPKIRKYISL
jgi:FemAB-related protein (PEP-CTERM system-associated)